MSQEGDVQQAGGDEELGMEMKNIEIKAKVKDDNSWVKDKLKEKRDKEKSYKEAEEEARRRGREAKEVEEARGNREEHYSSKDNYGYKEAEEEARRRGREAKEEEARGNLEEHYSGKDHYDYKDTEDDHYDCKDKKEEERDAKGCKGMLRDDKGCQEMPREAKGCQGMPRDILRKAHEKDLDDYEDTEDKTEGLREMYTTNYTTYFCGDVYGHGRDDGDENYDSSDSSDDSDDSDDYAIREKDRYMRARLMQSAVKAFTELREDEQTMIDISENRGCEWEALEGSYAKESKDVQREANRNKKAEKMTEKRVTNKLFKGTKDAREDEDEKDEKATGNATRSG